MWDFATSAGWSPFAIARIAFEKSAPDSARTAGFLRLTAMGTALSLANLEAHLHVESPSTSLRFIPTFEFARLDDANAVLRKGEKLERLEREPDVLQGRDVEPADEQQLVRPVERGEHRPVEEGRRVHDDDVIGLAGHLQEPGQLRLRDELGVLSGRTGAGRMSRPDVCRVV